ncbi:MAG TPA: NADP-dependent oxidoreductase [Streptosporangiaceae bacterium]|nr:NADP-dependent oxidoreductase [Streptosporangiaceae bacterium]
MAVPKTMRALRIHQRGGPDGLRVEEMDVPAPALDDVLLEVRAASFTPTELDWPSTWVDRAGSDRRPVVPGHEVSGVVAGLGYGAAGFAVGTEVFGLADWYRDGAAAEFVAVEARNLAPKPASLSHAEAAAATLAGLTAWQALFVHGRLQPGQTVMIHGAAGGVGTYAVQLAHAAGARVIGTGRAPARDLVLELGADEFADLGKEERAGRADPVDLVVDLVGGEPLQSSWQLVRPGGTVVSVVDASVASASAEPPAAGIRGVFFVVEPDRVQLTELARRFDVGELRPVVGRVFDLEAGREAFGAKRAGGLPGKAVLQVSARAD